MATTREVTFSNVDWVAVNTGDVTHVTLQLKSPGPALVQVSATKPAPASIDGMVLSRGALEELPLPGLVAGNIVWVRSLDVESNRIASYQVV